MKPNKSLHWIFTPLRFVKTSKLKRWAPFNAVAEIDNV